MIGSAFAAKRSASALFALAPLSCASRSLGPEIKTPCDALVAATAIMRAVAGGDLTPSEAAELGKLVENFTCAAEAADLAERIKRLERIANNS